MTSSVKTIRRVGARPSTRSSPKIARSTSPAAVLRTMYPDFRYQPIAEPEELGNAGRVKWVEGRSSQSPAVTGTDFILPGTVALPQFISFSTSYPELDSAVQQSILSNLEKELQPTERDEIGTDC
jgi:hypothetical protein